VPRLRRSDSSGKGLHRVRAGRGFRYLDVSGATLTDADLIARVEHLAIPPAWSDVWIAPYANGHIQATGTDAAGRTQYIYHPTWRQQKDRVKFDRAMALAESLPTARQNVTLDLRAEGPTKERALAAAFRLLDTGSLRVGSERYAEQHGSHGLSTLLCSHVMIAGDTITLDFPGKSGQEWQSTLVDGELATVLRGLKRRGGAARLLAWKEGRAWHPVDAADINDYVRERTGGEFSAKDFRTLHGTVTAAIALAEAGPRPLPTARKKVVAQVMRDVADVLGNTPAIARASYVDPRLVDHYDRGRTIDPARTSSSESQLRAMLFD